MIVSRDDIDDWDRYVRGFRRDHNFVVSAGVSKGTWNVKSFGTIKDRQFKNSGVYSLFTYAFHLPLYKGFGYLLGSTFGYHYEASDARAAFRPVPSFIFPG